MVPAWVAMAHPSPTPDIRYREDAVNGTAMIDCRHGSRTAGHGRQVPPGAPGRLAGPERVMHEGRAERDTDRPPGGETPTVRNPGAAGAVGNPEAAIPAAIEMASLG